MPQLTERQEQEAETRTNVSALVVPASDPQDGDEGSTAHIPPLAWSGLAAQAFDDFHFVSELFEPALARSSGR